MIVVSDTSPLLNLAAAGSINLLRVLYGEVVIPPAVDFELHQQRLRSNTPLLDCGSERAIPSTGLLGVLAEAKKRGHIAACRPILDSMIEAAGFWISSDLRKRYLLSLGEAEGI